MEDGFLNYIFIYIDQMDRPCMKRVIQGYESLLVAFNVFNDIPI